MQLQLTNTDLCAEIDAEDLDKILQHSHCWSVGYDKYGNRKIVRVAAWSQIVGKSISITQAILGFHSGVEIDHRDRNPLNNKKDNLRIITKTQNSWNQGPRNGKKYKGTGFVAKTNSWKVAIRYGEGRQYQKTGFQTEVGAAIHANEMYRKLHGEFAYQNVIETKEEI
jgi:hypothetical protein